GPSTTSASQAGSPRPWPSSPPRSPCSGGSPLRRPSATSERPLPPRVRTGLPVRTLRRIRPTARATGQLARRIDLRRVDPVLHELADLLGHSLRLRPPPPPSASASGASAGSSRGKR